MNCDNQDLEELKVQDLQSVLSPRLLDLSKK